ncbi:hypothetical protein [Rhizomonospora bruguierae]|uniref:hypothetical protein n=1 Tax=Rhizomonospora bruguierae TaxID=1581705 RepID=UPI001BCEC6CF|nr:hypothetical protein [Micromonospora sp. NBRC 107566]
MDPVTAGVLAATVVPLASGAAGEAGKQAWNSLLTAFRRRFGRDAAASVENAITAGETADAESVMGEVVRSAESDAEFAGWLQEWIRDAAPLAQRHTAVRNVVAGQAEIGGGLVQAHTINGAVTFGAQPTPREIPRIDSSVDSVQPSKVSPTSGKQPRDAALSHRRRTQEGSNEYPHVQSLLSAHPGD